MISLHLLQAPNLSLLQKRKKEENIGFGDHEDKGAIITLLYDLKS